MSHSIDPPGRTHTDLRVIALLATHNEERFVSGCIEHLIAHGCDVYLLDDASTDRTVEIARRHLGRGLIATEALPRSGVFSWRSILERKSELAASLDADWFLHVDADEIRLPPRPELTLAAALKEADEAGFNAVNFQEFTFVPTRERPDHDHERFRETMRHYYPFLPRFPHRLNAWKRQPAPVDLASGAGHLVGFPGLRMHRRSFPMLHYLYLSVEHAVRKYGPRRYDPEELAAGWHGGRAAVRADAVPLLPQAGLRESRSDHELDASDPWRRHPLFEVAMTEAAGTREVTSSSRPRSRRRRAGRHSSP